MDDQPDPKLLERVDEGRRASLKKILLGSAFAVPVIASFTMSGLGVNEAYAGIGNVTTGHHPHCQPPHYHQPHPCQPGQTGVTTDVDPHSHHK
jgi:hypothetical protein